MQELNRCWLGFPVPSAFAQKIADVQFAIKRKAGGEGARWLPAPELALFLVTIGEISPMTITRVQSVVSQVVQRHKPIALRLEGAGGSPNAVMPKSAWIGVNGDKPALFKLQQDLAICVKPLVQAIDDKPFEPVVEIGILRKFEERARTELGRAIKISATGVIGDFTLGSVHLFASTVTPTGLTLKSVFELPLAN